MDKYLDARLRLIDVTLTTVLRRQGIISAMILAARYDDREAVKYLQTEMLEAMDKYQEDIKKIMKNLGYDVDGESETKGDSDECHD
ncbi:hypothetical protein [Megamonas hypermegale]|uniref:hypothetical protein n=1 Tax=Megamonas hypermegale TaxID=158847 RepID=UPI0026F0543F|nr:hypothetical protein [Megamonas hypermegale]